jgi:phage terminase small subunit
MKRLSARQQRFVEEYAVDCNAARAAKAAGYSSESARQIGAENLTKPYIRREIENARERRALAVKQWTEQRIKEIRALLDPDISLLFDEQGWVKPLNTTSFPKELIEYLKVREVRAPNGKLIRRSFSIRFVDRTALLKELGQLLRAWD